MCVLTPADSSLQSQGDAQRSLLHRGLPPLDPGTLGPACSPGPPGALQNPSHDTSSRVQGGGVEGTVWEVEKCLVTLGLWARRQARWLSE